jgi:hypothetical protein
MDVVGGYLGRSGKVDGHVCLGWSLGGHAAWEAWLGEGRLDAVVSVVGCPDFMSEFPSSQFSLSDNFLCFGLLTWNRFPQC